MDHEPKFDHSTRWEFWLLATLGLIAIGVQASFSAVDRHQYFPESLSPEFRRHRFAEDNTHGATANAVEWIAENFHEPQPSLLMIRCLLWLIFLMLWRINRTIQNQTTRLLTAANRKANPPKR